MRKLFLVFFFLWQPVFGTACTLKDLSEQIKKPLKVLVDAVVLGDNFKGFMSKINTPQEEVGGKAAISKEKTKKDKRSRKHGDDEDEEEAESTVDVGSPFMKIYCAIRAIKELSDEEAWLKIKGDLSENPEGFHDTHLLAHVIYGHFLSPLFGEASKLFIGKSKYFEKSCNAWRVDDTSRRNPVFIANFVYEMSRLLQNTLYEHVEVQEDGRKKTFNIVLYTNLQHVRPYSLKMNKKCLFAQMYTNLKLNVGETVPQTNASPIVNYRLKSITLMVNPVMVNQLNSTIKQAPVVIVPPAKEDSPEPAIFSVAPVCSSKIFNPRYQLLETLISFLNEFNADDGVIGVGERGVRRGHDRGRGSSRESMASRSCLGFSSATKPASELIVSTLWPEFAPSTTKIEKALEECEKGKNEEEESFSTSHTQQADLSPQAHDILVAMGGYQQYTNPTLISTIESVCPPKKEKESNFKFEEKTFIDWFSEKEGKKKLGWLQCPHFREALAQHFTSASEGQKETLKKTLEKYIAAVSKNAQTLIESLVELASRIGIKLTFDPSLNSYSSSLASVTTESSGCGVKSMIFGPIEQFVKEQSNAQFSQVRTVIFNEQPTAGDGDCGYHALDLIDDQRTTIREEGKASTSRTVAYNLLLNCLQGTEEKKQKIAELIAPDIRDRMDYLVELFGLKKNSDLAKRISNLQMERETLFQAETALRARAIHKYEEINSANIHPSSTDGYLEGQCMQGTNLSDKIWEYIDSLGNKSEYEELLKRRSEIQKQLEEQEEKEIAFCMESSVVHSYIDSFVKPSIEEFQRQHSQEWLSIYFPYGNQLEVPRDHTGVADAIAYLTGRNLTFIQKNIGYDSKGTVLRQSQFGMSSTMYLINTGNYHYTKGENVKES